MKVKDQLKLRREQLGVSVNELAKRLGVSAQSVRYWEQGRSFPGKSKTSALESALSFNIDWTEGAKAAQNRSQISALIDPNDVALLLQIARLPPPAKALIGDLVEMHLRAIDGESRMTHENIRKSPERPYFEREVLPRGDPSFGTEEAATTARKRKPAKAAGQRGASRRKAA